MELVLLRRLHCPAALCTAPQVLLVTLKEGHAGDLVRGNRARCRRENLE